MSRKTVMPAHHRIHQSTAPARSQALLGSFGTESEPLMDVNGRRHGFAGQSSHGKRSSRGGWASRAERSYNRGVGQRGLLCC